MITASSGIEKTYNFSPERDLPDSRPPERVRDVRLPIERGDCEGGGDGDCGDGGCGDVGCDCCVNIKK